MIRTYLRRTKLERTFLRKTSLIRTGDQFVPTPGVPGVALTSPLRLMYDDDPVDYVLQNGATDPTTLDMNNLGAQVWVDEDPAINYVAGTGKAGLVEYEETLLTVVATSP